MSSLAKQDLQCDLPSEHVENIVDIPPPPSNFSPEEQRRIWRKIDLRLMPILSLMYLLSFLDRGNIGNAKLEGLTKQLNLTGDQYNIALTMFFIPYCVFECPSNLVLKLFRPSRWLPGITIIWGIAMTLMSLVKTYPQLVGVRLCLGVAEAGLFPGVVYYLTLWYPREMLQYRIALFFGAASLAGAFSGLFAFGISFMSGTAGLLGWSWIFLLEGIATVLVAVVALFTMVDFPDTAKFLTVEERDFVLWRKRYDTSSSGEAEHFAFQHVWAAFTDWQVWMCALINISVIGPLYAITLFLPTIISDFGYDTTVSELLTIPPYIVATLVLLIFAHYSDKLRLRSPFLFVGLCVSLIGFVINISNASSGAKYFGTFCCVIGSYSAFPGVIAWLGSNLSGQYKRGVGLALIICFGNLSGAVASNVYLAEDSPRYILGHAIEILFVSVGLVSVPAVAWTYHRINKHRDNSCTLRDASKGRLDNQEVRELGDRAPDFRYIL